MADLLGAANRVPGYEVSNQHTAGTAIQAGDRQVKNVPDPTRVGRVVLSVAGLSYLGLGIEPPTPDWGEMVSGTARRYFRSAPHLLWAPGICIILLTLSINLLGDLLRDRLDVKQDAVKEL